MKEEKKDRRGEAKKSKKKPTWSERDRFVNPYHFVSAAFAGKESVDIAKRQEELHTGVLDCRLVVKTPLAILSTEYREENDHKIYSYNQDQNGKPFIQAGSLRGVIRSVHETVTDSCFSTAKVDEIITSRSNHAFWPGVLLKGRNGKWKLFPAERYLIKVEEYAPFQKDKGACMTLKKEELLKIGFGTKVYFKPVLSDEEKDAASEAKGYSVKNYIKEMKLECEAFNWKEGYLYLGEPISGKHFESVFCISKKTPIDVPDLKGAMERLGETVSVYQNAKVNKKLGEQFMDHHGYPGYKKALENGVIPVWYSSNKMAKGSPVYLSMACLGRMAYETNMGKLLNKKAPCTSRNQLCSSCALFGMASEEKLGSRVRFTDASAIHWSENSLEKGVTLRELSSPQSSYLPFYTKKPKDVVNWSYDNGIEILGRKYYWHSESDYYKEVEFNGEKQNVERNNRNITVDLIKPKTSFSFRVYYDQITARELEGLIWTLTLGENQKDGKLCHKLGHGKPMGLGSVKILVDKKTERAYRNGYQLKETVYGQVENPFAKQNAGVCEELLKVLNMDTVKKWKVEYPRVIPSKKVSTELENVKQDKKKLENVFASHQWFSANYKLGTKKIYNPFPTLDYTDLSMKSLVVTSLKNSKQKEEKNTNRDADGKRG